MSYICENCGLRPENCICSSDITEPRLEVELSVADNIMAVENPIIQAQYGLIDAPSPVEFFSLLGELEKKEVYDSFPSTPIIEKDFLPIPKLERQTIRPRELFTSQNNLNDVRTELFPEPLIPDVNFSDFYFGCPYQLAKEKYELDKACWNSAYDDFCSDLPENEPCYDCGKKFLPNSSYNICNECAAKMMEQDLIDKLLYLDDIAMELRYDSDRYSF
jgi:hypothetical protein